MNSRNLCRYSDASTPRFTTGRVIFSAFLFLVSTLPSTLQAVDIDLSGASSSTLISAPGGSFASLFAGQALSGSTGVSGSPTGPLTLQPASTLEVAFFDPSVSPAANSILPPPNNQGPLSILFDSAATSLTLTMGSASPPSSIKVDFFDNSGNVVNSVNQPFSSNYAIYNYSGFGTFRGLTFSDNDDASGVRFMNISYVAVPEPGACALVLGLSVAYMFQFRRR